MQRVIDKGSSMLQESIDARRRAVSPVFARMLGLLALAGAILAAMPQAHGAMQAAVGVYRPTLSRFFLDGDFDHFAELKLNFGAPGLDVGLLGDLAGSGSRYPILFRGGVWYVDS